MTHFPEVTGNSVVAIELPRVTDPVATILAKFPIVAARERPMNTAIPWSSAACGNLRTRPNRTIQIQAD
jgi:hypothetical protein